MDLGSLISRFVTSALVLLVVVNVPGVDAVSFGVDGQPTIYEDTGRLCFRVERYVYSHSVISFLNWSRDIDTRNIQLLDLSVGTDTTDWSIRNEGAPASGMRLRKSTSICYGEVPSGFVTTDIAEPLVAGRYSILMNARDEEGSLRFFQEFCLSNDAHIVDCDDGEKSRKPFLKQLFDWIFGS